ncbi:MAG TPA: helical backbone metal receptor [Kofleriaceae bacterium]|nr:helical backbone metal receptor [Kofleriaceae bacterium]
MSTLKIDDDLGRTLLFGRAPRRIVSLVPSDTYSVIALGAGDRLVGRTTYCEHGEGVATVGGTKDADPAKILALEPDLVIANQEENVRRTLEALAGKAPVLVSLPRTVEQGIAHLARLARILETGPQGNAVVARGYQLVAKRAELARVFVPIWLDPLMTLNADTFGSDVLARAGLANAFSDRLRLYPLAADLGKGDAIEATGRDVRYPRLTLDELRARDRVSKIDAIVLPDEPYAFSAADEAALQAALPDARVVRTPGKDLFWYGAWTIDAMPRVIALAESIRAHEVS